MKKILGLILVVTALAVMVTPAFAVKSEGAQSVNWNLSAAVAPAPPYGTMDIPGSDTASKLIVNQPNGNTVVTITGAMNGLHASTPYMVYLSRGYTPLSSWPGLFTGTIPAFTFLTDEYGAGSWHLNLRDENFPGPGTYNLSVWINEAGKTMLISDTFSVVVE